MSEFSNNNYDLDRSNLGECFYDEDYALKVTRKNEEVFVNQNNYNKWFNLCSSAEYSCFDLKTFDDSGNKINVFLVKQNV